MTHRRTGLTIVEILVVVGIIALLTGMLIPAVHVVKTTAREVKQKAQFTAIELGLAAFKNDDGDYPPSDWTPVPITGNYCGAQKLAEALLGRDLLGYHPRSNWDPLDLTWYPDPAATLPAQIEVNLQERKGLYLELTSAHAFRLGNMSLSKPGLFANTGSLAPDTFVLCDVFTRTPVRQRDGKMVKAGAPILYYRADASKKAITDVYDILDNDAIVSLKEVTDGRSHPLGAGPYPPPFATQLEFFYGNPTLPGAIGYIQDPRVTAIPRPYKRDSYILVSAGADGTYGTDDDITNFRK